MIKRMINIDNYWRVIVYYNVDYDSYRIVSREVKEYTSPVEEIDYAVFLLINHRAKAFTISTSRRISVMCFRKHRSIRDYLNSIVHEAEHVKQAMLKYYRVRDRGEPPAYTIGYIASRLISIFLNVVVRESYNR